MEGSPAPGPDLWVKVLSPSKSARASSEPGAGRSGLGVHASALSGRYPEMGVERHVH